MSRRECCPVRRIPCGGTVSPMCSWRRSTPRRKRNWYYGSDAGIARGRAQYVGITLFVLFIIEQYVMRYNKFLIFLFSESQLRRRPWPPPFQVQPFQVDPIFISSFTCLEIECRHYGDLCVFVPPSFVLPVHSNIRDNDWVCDLSPYYFNQSTT